MNYWNKREVKLRDELLTVTEAEINKKLAKEYQAVAKRLVDEILKLYNELLAENGKVTADHLYRYNRYYKLLGEINKELKKLGQKQIKLIDKKFYEVYEQNLKILRPTSTYFNKELAKSVINEYWVGDGLMWSDRIWKNQQLLASELQKGIFEVITRGCNTNELISTLMSKFDTSITMQRDQ